MFREDHVFCAHGEQVLMISDQQLDREVLRACRVADFNFLGFIATAEPNRLLRVRDSRDATPSHYAARTGQLSVLRYTHPYVVFLLSVVFKGGGLFLPF